MTTLAAFGSARAK